MKIHFPWECYLLISECKLERKNVGSIEDKLVPPPLLLLHFFATIFFLYVAIIKISLDHF
ncbi:hypothetical protein [Ehrlichia minasensis]|uniref:hypothetical protein n=1 Tax=Ehrlichia minasensis TaxID=1242993 RepID=UPI0013EE55FA|nr:hypothetical protein [Ehrlichia minasensis]